MQTDHTNPGSIIIFENKGKLSKMDQIYKNHREEHHWRAYTIERNKYNKLLKYHKKQVITLMGSNTDNP